jgi:hypothetical protein
LAQAVAAREMGRYSEGIGDRPRFLICFRCSEY